MTNQPHQTTLRRSSWVSPQSHNLLGSRQSSVGTVYRREKLQEQAVRDKSIFDQSLGCPLSSFDLATLALVGGKALQCWKLTKHGFPLPSSYVVLTYAYSLHVHEAGIGDLIEEVFQADLRQDEVRSEAASKLETIRNQILKTELNSHVVRNLNSFLETLPNGTCFAVRSSATAEDLANQSFAGQYDTFLYKTSVKDISDAIKACWASMFKSHILDYASSSEDYMPGKIDTPSMAVLVMHMVEAKVSGVLFTENLWGNKKDAMIEAVPGQGEGLVSGEITPDRYVINKYSLRLTYKNVGAKTHKFVRADNQDGVEKVKLDKISKEPLLTEDQLQYLAKLASSIENFENQSQDVEWALDEAGAVYLLQSRPITTSGEKSLSFLPPGDGFWTFDPTHFPRPVSPWMQAVYAYDYGIKHSQRIGCLIKSIDIRFVHGYAFTQPIMFPENKLHALESAGKAYWSKKLYEDDYREFNDWFRPECEALTEKLCSVNPAAMGHAELVEHVEKCYDYAAEFWKKHHTYTFPAFALVGDYMNHMSVLTGKDPMECLVLLESTSPESRGILNQQDPLLGKMYSLLRQSERAKRLLECGENNASWSLDCLLHMPDELGDTMREVALHYGWRLAGGYDIVVPALIESPNFLLKTILQGVNSTEDLAIKGEEKTKKLAEAWKNELPIEKHERFDELLTFGRRFFRLRDERGLATDLSGVGLCRRGILEAGRRLADSGVIKKRQHLTVAVKREALALLTGDLGALRGGEKGILEVPTAEVLEKRFNHIKNANPNLVPRSLGNQPENAPEIPDSMRFVKRTMKAMECSLTKGTFDQGTNDEDTHSCKNMVKGTPASMGKVTGPVCLVLDDSDLQKVRKGDIVVTYSSSASFNIVLGLCSAIVTDYGGMLSHAAIVAREYGIPAVVGTQNATRTFKNGDTVCVDSSHSRVTRMESVSSSPPPGQ